MKSVREFYTARARVCVFQSRISINTLGYNSRYYFNIFQKQPCQRF
nr:MAG TPA: hypothetical protein [Caudoviricetes sp.]